MAKLDFPQNPQPGDEYHFTPFTYRWDGEKWKTLGRGSTPVADAIDEHKADHNAHAPLIIGAFPYKGEGLDQTNLNTLTASKTHEGFYYQDSSAKALVDAYHYPIQEAGSLVVSRSAWGVQQEYTTYGTGRKFSRGKSSATEWLPWKEYFINDGGAALLINKPHGAIYLKAPNDTDPCYIICTTAGANSWYVGKGGTSNDVILSSYKHNNFIAIKSDRVEAAKPLYVGSKRVLTEERHHYSGHNMTCNRIPIPVGGNDKVYPQVRLSSLGITLDGNHDLVVSRSGKYRIDWGFSVETTGANQQGVGAIWRNGTVIVPALIYNYCPPSTVATVIGISSASVIIDLLAGDKISLVVTAANNTSVKIYQSGSIVVQEL